MEIVIFYDPLRVGCQPKLCTARRRLQVTTAAWLSPGLVRFFN